MSGINPLFCLSLALASLWCSSLPQQAFAKGSQKTTLFVRKNGKDFQTIFEGMSKELKNYSKMDYIIAENTSYTEFEARMKTDNPDFLVLMDNRSVDFGMQWNKTSVKKIPGVGLMALNLQSILKQNPYISGITFESPAYTLVTQFRYVVDAPVKNILVFYRKSVFSEIIEQSRDQLSKEKIRLEAVDVEADGKSKEDVEKFIKSKTEKYFSEAGKYDAVWCILDSVLLSTELFQQFWLPTSRKSKIPIITGVEQLVSPKMDFAVFAVTPNLSDLASQAVQMIERVLEENEKPSKVGVEQLISVDKVIDIDKAKSLQIKVHDERIQEVKVLK